MKRGLTGLFIVTATPALAHHEVVVATSVAPLATTIAGLSVAALLAWRKWHRSTSLRRTRKPASR